MPKMIRKSQMQEAMLKQIAEKIKLMQVQRNDSMQSSDDSGIQVP